MTDTSTTALRRRGRPPGLAGSALLAVARDMFLRDGLAGTTMAGIASAAGISKQTLYASHPSKDALYAAVVRDWVERGRHALAPSVATLRDGNDVGAGLDQLCAALQRGVLSPPVLGIRALVAAHAGTHPEVAAEYRRESWQRNLRVLADALATVAARGDLRLDDPRTAAEQLVWLVLGPPLNDATLSGGHHRWTRPRLDRLRAEAIATFLTRYGA